MAVSWTSQEPEVTRNIDKQGLTLLKQAGTGIENGNSYNFGVKVVSAAWEGAAGTDLAVLSVSGTLVICVTGGAVDGTIYAWVKDYN